ncbi:MAG TPA: T9SS type A sorting domain-containing protein, partial [bacterium]
YPNGDVFKSTNGGNAWVNTSDLSKAKIVRALIELPNGKIIAGTSPDSAEMGRMFITTDEGTNWRLKTTPAIAKASVHSFFYNDGVLYSGLRAGGDNILISTNSGETWSEVNLPFDDNAITLTDFYFFYKTSDNAIWTGGWAHGPQGVVARTTDNGVTWTAASEIRFGNQVEMARIFSMVELENGTVLAGGHPGPDSVVAATTDNGVTWAAYGTLPKANELLCFLKSRDGSVYAGTTPNGDVFKLASTTGVSGSKGGPKSFSLSQNYPNPFNPDTYIHFRLGLPARVNLSVYDVSGKRVRLLAEGERRTGDVVLLWDGCDDSRNPLPSGVYIYRLTVRESNGTIRQEKKKMLMVK